MPPPLLGGASLFFSLFFSSSLSQSHLVLLPGPRNNQSNKPLLPRRPPRWPSKLLRRQRQHCTMGLLPTRGSSLALMPLIVTIIPTSASSLLNPPQISNRPGPHPLDPHPSVAAPPLHLPLLMV